MRRTMILNAFLSVLLITVVVACGGCITTTPRVDTYTVYEEPPCDLKNAVYEDKDMLLVIKPMPHEIMASRKAYDRRITFFALTITNKTKRDLSIEWTDVYFINKNNKLHDGFYQEYGSYNVHGHFKQPLLILANSTHAGELYPQRERIMEEGTFGVYISKISGQEKRIRVTVDIGKTIERKIEVTR